MPKLDKPIIGDVTIETPPETIDPGIEVPEMLAPPPSTDTIYNPPMQQGVQQASMLNEFLKQATGEKPLASLNIGDYVQCATARISLTTPMIYKGVISQNVTLEKIDITAYEYIDIYVQSLQSNVRFNIGALIDNSHYASIESYTKEHDKFHYKIPEHSISVELYFQLLTDVNIEADTYYNILVYPSFKEEEK